MVGGGAIAGRVRRGAAQAAGVPAGDARASPSSGRCKRRSRPSRGVRWARRAGFRAAARLPPGAGHEEAP
jgi:hypothetical protein